MLDSQDDRRAVLVRGLVEGTLPFAEAAAAARAHGLLPGGRYCALRARAGEGVSAQELARAIAATGGLNGRGALAAVVEGEVIAVVGTRPRVPPKAVGGVGTPAGPAPAAPAFRPPDAGPRTAS